MRPRIVRLVLLAAAAVVLLAACGTSAVVITITSHTDGQRVLGSRTVTLAGTLSGGAVSTVTVELNGAPVAGVTHSGTSFSASLDLADRSNAIVVSASSSGSTSTKTLTLVYPHVALATFQPAAVVIGQPDFTTNGDNLTRAGLGGVYGSPALIGGVLYLSDYGQDRVLGFTGGVPTVNGAPADFVLGQPDFVTDVAGASAYDMDGPQTVVAGGGRMYVAEYGNNRVLIYDTPPTSTHAPADHVVGQLGFGTYDGACTASGMDSLESIFVVGTKLIVADAGNNRVLIFNSLPTADGAAADVVLGQDSFTTCESDDDNQDGMQDASPTARTLDYPSDVWSDGTRLVVADADNNRVLIWNTFPTGNFEPADVVLGQSDMVSDAAGAGATGMTNPYFLGSNGNQLFVADADNNRVLVFEALPTANGAAADAVLGQGDFTHVTANDDNQDDVDDGAPSARSLSYPTGFLVLEDGLLVADHDNSRVLVFRP